MLLGSSYAKMARNLSTIIKMIKLFLPNKKTLILVSGLGIFILVLMFVSLFSDKTPPPEPESNPIATTQPLNNLPPLDKETTDNLPQIYKDSSLEKNYERIVNKKQLTPEEIKIKQKLIAPFEGNSGIVTTTNDFRIEYLKTPQYFMVQILSNDIEAAKENLQKWFNSQGLSNEGICNLPVILYPSENVSDYLINNNLQFDPTPRGCE